MFWRLETESSFMLLPIKNSFSLRSGSPFCIPQDILTQEGKKNVYSFCYTSGFTKISSIVYLFTERNHFKPLWNNSLGRFPLRLLDVKEE